MSGSCALQDECFFLHSLELFNPLDSCVSQPCPSGWMNLYSLELLNPLDSCVWQPCPAGWRNLHSSLELFNPLGSCVGQPCPGVNESLLSWAVSLLDSCLGQLCPAGWMILHSLKLFNPLGSCVGQPCHADGWVRALRWTEGHYSASLRQQGHGKISSLTVNLSMPCSLFVSYFIKLVLRVALQSNLVHQNHFIKVHQNTDVFFLNSHNILI